MSIHHRFKIPITLRQAQYVALSANGLTKEQIAQVLFVSVNTVSATLTDARKKVDAANTTELACLCVEAGYIYWENDPPRFRAFVNS